MKKLINLVCILGAAGLLAACSYFDTGEEVDVSSAQPVEGEQVEAVELAPVEYRDVAEVIRQSSDGRVQIFPLDGGEEWPAETSPDAQPTYSGNDAIEIKPVHAVPTYQEGYNANYLNAYPGVEIFPLDDQMATLVNPRLVPPSTTPLTPLAGERQGGFVSLSVPGGSPVIVYFDHDSVTLNQADSMMVTGLGRSYGGENVLVEGHASVTSSIQDPVQRKIINLKISMDRAFAVARALIEGGIPPERIETKGYGEIRPPAEASQPLEVASRRVEIYGVSVQ